MLPAFADEVKSKSSKKSSEKSQVDSKSIDNFCDSFFNLEKRCGQLQTLSPNKRMCHGYYMHTTA